MEHLVVGGKYHVVQTIGRGGMGVVYDAIHAGTGRRVALKLIHELLMTGGGRRRFEREARAAAAIDSLHVVQILDSGEDEPSRLPFIVMEYLNGEDLRALLGRGRIPERLAIAIALQICLGLKKAHENDVVHRDLKPGNVFLAQTDDGRRVVKLLDFGIAKLLAEGDRGTADLTVTADVVGSPPYMSPEQLRTPRDVDTRSDIWALGVLLYEMLSGRTPTAGVEPIGARVYAICHTPSPPIRDIAPEVSPALAAVVHRALEIDRTKRFASVDEMADDLRVLSPFRDAIVEQDLLDLGVGTTAPCPRSASAFHGADAPNDEPSSVVVREMVTPPTRKRSKIVAAAIGLSALGIVVWAGLQRASTPMPRASTPSTTLPPAPTVDDAAAGIFAVPSFTVPAPVDQAPPLPTSTPGKVESNRRPGASRPPKSEPSCDPPYTVDMDGHRHYRPECMTPP